MRLLEPEGEDVLLTNAEVLDHLNEAKASARLENLQTIIVEIQAYLRERPAGNPEEPQTAENIAEFVRHIREQKIQLEKAEIFQIINAAPTSMPVLFCLIEEADIRLSEDQLQLILDLSQKYLGNEPQPTQ